MLFDFETMLVLVTLLTGITVAWAAFRRRQVRASGSYPAREGWWIELCRSLFPVILLVLIIRSTSRSSSINPAP